MDLYSKFGDDLRALFKHMADGDFTRKELDRIVREAKPLGLEQEALLLKKEILQYLKDGTRTATIRKLAAHLENQTRPL